MNDSTRREEIFLEVSRAVCLDGEIQKQELRLLKSLGSALGLPTERANVLANQAIREYRAGELKGRSVDCEGLYRVVLQLLAADDLIDAHDDELLDQFREVLKLGKTCPDGIDSSESLPNAAEREPSSGTSGCDASSAIPGSELAAGKTVCDGVPAVPASKGAAGQGSRDSSPRPRPAASKGALEPLLCPNCEAPIPLGRGMDMTCPYCRHLVPIPQDYVEARALRMRAAIKQDEANRLFRRLGKPPGVALTILSRVSGCFLLMVCFFALMLLPMLFQLFTKAVAKYYLVVEKVNPMDVYSVDFMATTYWALVLLIFLVPFQILYAIRFKVLAQEQIMRSLASAPPEKPGGPALCRRCGAPLLLPANAFGVTCEYCQTDNLARVEQSFVSKTHAFAEGVCTDIFQAQHIMRREVLQALIAGGITILVIVSLGWWRTGHWQEEYNLRRDFPDYRTMLARRKSLLTRHKIEIPLGKPTMLHMKDFRDSVWVYVPLKAGERIKLRFQGGRSRHEAMGDFSVRTSYQLLLTYPYNKPRIDPSYMTLEEHKAFLKTIPPSHSAVTNVDYYTRRVDIGGWYTLKISLVGLIKITATIDIES